MNIHWDENKNELLKRDRGISFEEVVKVIQSGDELDIIPHPKRSNQQIIVLRIHNYVHAVPFVKDETGIFLKTIFPSRILNREYGGKLL